LHTHSLLCYLFCFTLFIFTCIVLLKPQKKLEFLLVAFTYLFLVLLKWPILKILSCVTLLVIRPKRIYFSEHFCYCFSSNFCVLNTTNMDWRYFQQNCSGVSFWCRNQLSVKIQEKSSKILFHQKTHGARRRDREEAWGPLTHRWRGPALAALP
jgi:hypothetical protein